VWFDSKGLWFWQHHVLETTMFIVAKHLVVFENQSIL
jgi:hypothetical protein